MSQKQFVIMLEESDLIGHNQTEVKVSQSPDLKAVEVIGLLIYALMGELLQSGLLSSLLQQLLEQMTAQTASRTGEKERIS